MNLAYPPVTSRLITDQGPAPIGMIQTVTLSGDRVKEIAAKVEDLEKQGAKKLILDLRHCDTGSPEQGIALANLFLDKGLISYSMGQRVRREDYDANPSKAITKLPLAVIVNRGTAGPAEIAAAALLDSKRADVVGEHTYGDAAIRKPVTMEDGSAVILSVAKYYSPSGKAIQDTGVTPNIAQSETDPNAVVDDDQDLPDTPDTLNPPGANPKPSADLMLKAAIDAVNKK